MSGTFSDEKLRADLVQYSAMGEHRTASAIDHVTSNWIRRRLEAAGFTAELQPWTLRQFQLKECWVEVYGKRLEAFPLWYPKATGPTPICDRLTLSGETVSGRIALTQFSDIMVTPKSDHASKIQDSASAGARAIVGCTPHPSGEVYGQNVIPPYNQTPWPIPVVMIAPRNWHILEAAAIHNDKISVHLSGDDELSSVAYNVAAKLERGDSWIIISTPQSGWFRCASERGAGVALLIALAKWASASDLPHSFLFLSTTGHEIGHMGIHNLMETYDLPLPTKTECWLHLGSSIGAFAFDSDSEGLLIPSGAEPESWLFSSANMINALERNFAEFTHLKPEIYNRKNGEIRWILESGYTAFALMGSQKFFHLDKDGPENVDASLLSKLGKAITKTFDETMAVT